MRKISVIATILAALFASMTFGQACPARGSCFLVHETPGCSDVACCTTVCSIDPFCCSDGWDSSCASIAGAVCESGGTPGVCRAPGTGDCFFVHKTGACNDEACCTAVCNADPTCCSVAWDQLCVALANSFCNALCEVACPATAQKEVETCGQNKNDTCFFPVAGSAVVFTLCGKTVCGRVMDNTGSRGTFTDVDIYRLTLLDSDGDGLVRVTLDFTSAFNGFAALTPVLTPPQCADLATITEITVPSNLCIPGNKSKCVPPGSYNIIISPGTFPVVGGETITCENNTYQFTATCSQNCAPPCSPESGECLEVHEEPGCNDAECCEAVCKVDPFCCERTWDDVCVSEAYQICAGPPENDECTTAVPITDGDTPFNNYAATTSTQLVPTGCISPVGQIGQDIWYTYTATCTGEVTVTTCNQADFDTVLVAYSGTCTSLVAAGCNNNADRCALGTSTLTFNAVCGETYLLRVGAVDEEIGIGTLTISCDGEPCRSCPADLDGSGEVDGGDLGLLLGAWDTPGPGDIDRSGIVDGGDLGLLLGAWGPCP